MVANRLPSPQSIYGDDPATYEKVVELLRNGTLSYAKIAQRVGNLSASSVSNIAAREGLSRGTAPVVAIQTRSTYCRARRIQLLDELFALVEQMIDDVDNPLDLGRLVAATATLIAKRRIEDDEPAEAVTTSNADVEQARRELYDALERLAASRAGASLQLAQ